MGKSNLPLVGTYHSTHTQYWTSDNDFFERLGLSRLMTNFFWEGTLISKRMKTWCYILQTTTTVSTGPYHFHEMIASFQKSKSKFIAYRDYSWFNENQFHRDLKKKLIEIRQCIMNHEYSAELFEVCHCHYKWILLAYKELWGCQK